MTSTSTRTVRLYVAGLGGVGSALLGQIAAVSRTRRAAPGLSLRLAGVAASRAMRLDDDGLEPASGRNLLESAPKLDLDGFVERARRASGKRIFVDVTASPEVAARYQELLEAGLAVVTANKLRLASDMQSFERLTRGRLYYETTAGAALPVVSTLQALTSTGDRLRRVEGVFSGTLAYLFHRLREGEPFDGALERARSLGYTEPDPKEDLSGQDVARKLLIVARTAGFGIEPEEVSVESLVGQTDSLEERARSAESDGKRLTYLASFAPGTARVGLEAVDSSHPAASLERTDNLFVFETDRYCDSPLVIRGPGAGPAVTAGGVFADILRACRESTAEAVAL